MTVKSYRQMIAAKEVKRADGMKMRIGDIHEEPGFNLRDEGPDLDASIEALCAHIMAGGIVPPLEIRPRNEGGAFVVDGHRRRRAYLLALERGLSLPPGETELWLPVVAFVGNDAERVARVITSAENRSLSPLEVARGYARLVAWGWSNEQIAAKVGKTRQHVEQTLLLTKANSDVQELVKAGKVSASVAISQVRKHGDKAGAVLAQAVKTAESQGKTKATESAVAPPKIPRKLVEESVDFLAGRVHAFMVNGEGKTDLAALQKQIEVGFYRPSEISFKVEGKFAVELLGLAIAARAAKASA